MTTRNDMEELIGVPLCMDCMELMSGLPDNSVDLVVTDPPYGINYKSGLQCFDRRDNLGGSGIRKRDNNYFTEIVGDDTFPIIWFKHAYRIICDGGAFYTFCHWKTWGVAYDAAIDAGFNVKNMIVLNKSNHGMGDLKGSFAPKHELLLFAAKGRHLLNFPKGRDKDVWDVPVIFSKAIRLHPNRKPNSWIKPCIINSSLPGDIVLDPFAGSFTTAYVAQQLNRRWISCDISPEYVEIGRKRLSSIQPSLL